MATIVECVFKWFFGLCAELGLLAGLLLFEILALIQWLLRVIAWAIDKLNPFTPAQPFPPPPFGGVWDKLTGEMKNVWRWMKDCV